MCVVWISGSVVFNLGIHQNMYIYLFLYYFYLLCVYINYRYLYLSIYLSIYRKPRVCFDTSNSSSNPTMEGIFWIVLFYIYSSLHWQGETMLPIFSIYSHRLCPFLCMETSSQPWQGYYHSWFPSSLGPKPCWLPPKILEKGKEGAHIDFLRMKH